MIFIQRKIRELHWSQWLSLLGLALLFVALRWNNYHAPLIDDEGEIDYSARLLVQGIAPYQHAFIQKPPGVIYSYAFANLVLPQYFWAPRLLAYLFVAAATILLGVIARLEFGEKIALPTMWLMTPMVLLPGIDQFSCNPEMFLLLPLIATMAIYCYSRRHENKNQHWLAAGFFAVVTLIFKYNILPIFALVFIAWLFELYTSGSSIPAIVKAALSAVAGGIAALILGFGFYAMHHALGSVWECTVAFNKFYLSAGFFSWAFLGSRLASLWSSWWILFLMPCAILLKPQRRVWFWVGMLGGAFLTTSGSAYTQYYILIMPFWALLAALGIRTLADKIQAKLTKPIPWLAPLLATIVILLVVHVDAPWIFCSSKRFVRANDGSPFLEAPLVADKVARMTSPNDFVYVAGSEPEILCYAQRYSPTRFITSYPLMIPTPLALGYQQAAIQDLQARPPRVIVFVASGASWLRHADSPPDFFAFLNKFLDQNYQMVGGYIPGDGADGHWTEPITSEQFKQCSLVVFSLKNASLSNSH